MIITQEEHVGMENLEEISIMVKWVVFHLDYGTMELAVVLVTRLINFYMIYLIEHFTNIWLSKNISPIYKFVITKLYY